MLASKFPWIKILIAMICGILIGRFLPFSIPWSWLLWTISFFLTTYWVSNLKHLENSRLFNWSISPMAILVLFFLLAILDYRMVESISSELRTTEKETTFVVEIEEVLKSNA